MANDQNQKQAILLLASQMFDKTKKTLQALNQLSISKDITICLSIIFLTAFGRMTGGIFVQYTSKLLGWPISTVGYIISIKGLVTLGTLVLLATFTQIVERRTGTRPRVLDAWIVRLSLAALFAGGVLIGFGKHATVVIIGSMLSSAGNGIVQALQGILASVTNDTSTGQIFAGAALVQLIAQFAGSFVFAKLLDIGLGLPPWGIGLAFYTSAALSILAGILSTFLPGSNGSA